MSKQNSTTLAQRFWSKVDTSGGPDACWPWTAATNNHGYGIFNATAVGVNTAHRFSLMLALGAALPREVLSRHSCHNRVCCNPDHLFPGTVRDNGRDMREAGRGPGNSLPDADVIEILRATEAGVSRKDIARAFEISPSAVSRLTQPYFRFTDLGLMAPVASGC